MKCLFFIWMIAQLFFCPPERLNAQLPQPTYSGITSGVFNFVAASQRENEWCWAASIQMVLNYYNVAITQEEIAARTYGLDAYGRMANRGASHDVITANLNNWNIDNNGRKYIVQAYFVPGAPNASALVNELSLGHPVIISYRNYSTPGHVIVMTACSYYPTPYGPNIQTMIFRDPWPGQQNVLNKGRVEYLANFAYSITGCWFVSVQ